MLSVEETPTPVIIYAITVLFIFCRRENTYHDDTRFQCNLRVSLSLWGIWRRYQIRELLLQWCPSGNNHTKNIINSMIGLIRKNMCGICLNSLSSHRLQMDSIYWPHFRFWQINNSIQKENLPPLYVFQWYF